MYVKRSGARVLTLVVIAILAMALLGPVASYASTAGTRNTAAILTGIAAYELSRGNAGPGLLAAAGAGVAWGRYQDSRDRERYRDRYYYGGRSYGYYDNRCRDRDRDHDWDRDRHDRGNHYGWDRGKHKGWDRDRNRNSGNGRWDWRR